MMVGFCAGSGWLTFTAPAPLFIRITGGLFSLILLACLGSPQLWYRWVHLAADASGIYLRHGWALFQQRDGFLYVPWHQVGALCIEEVALADGPMRSVVMELSLTSSQWRLLTENRSLDGVSPGPLEVRRHVLGNHLLRPEGTRKALETLRGMSG